jgi:hypothetical protein
MKYLASLLLALSLSACATAGSKQSTVKGPFIVTGVGKTEELAKQDAFKKAVEYAIGVGIQTERITSDDTVARNYILSHSSGYIDSFRIIDTTEYKNRIEIDMEVYVRSTLVDDYIFKSAKVEQKINGNFIKEQSESYMQERHSGDQLLDAVLKDYPDKAYTIEQPIPAQFMVDENRKFFVRLRYKIRFSDEYLKSLAQVLSQVKDVDCTFKCGSYPSIKVVYRKKANDFLFENETFYFRDTFRVERVYKYLSGQNFAMVHSKEQNAFYEVRYALQLDFMNFSKNTVNTVCVFTDSAKTRRNLGGRHEYFITNQLIADEIIDVPVSFNGKHTKLQKNLNEFDNIKLSVVRPDKCVEK